MRGLIIPLLFSFISFASYSQITIEECIKKAEENYPLIKKYELLDATLDIDLSEINTTWFPKLGAYGQTTAQNTVPSFPQTLTGVLNQMGQDVKGLSKFQYKIGVDVTQPIWDGGASRARRKVARMQDAVRKSSLDVEIYAVRQRVEAVYFAILLIQEQIAQSEVTHTLLIQNLEKLRAMVKNGVAMESDADMIEAQALTISQKITSAKNASEGYREMLEIFMGESISGKDLTKPTGKIDGINECERPELRLFASRLEANHAANRLSNVSYMPVIGLFAQAYYGYPGFNYFKSMMTHDLSFNFLAGVRFSWNIDALYSKKNNSRRTMANASDITADKELFLFNTALQSTSQTKKIEGLRDVMKEDEKIIALRKRVRLAAEAQLENGIIDATALLSKISDENISRLNAKLHEIQLLQEIYNLKYTLNR